MGLYYLQGLNDLSQEPSFSFSCVQHLRCKRAAAAAAAATRVFSTCGHPLERQYIGRADDPPLSPTSGGGGGGGGFL